MIFYMLFALVLSPFLDVMFAAAWRAIYPKSSRLSVVMAAALPIPVLIFCAGFIIFALFDSGVRAGSIDGGGVGPAFFVIIFLWLVLPIFFLIIGLIVGMLAAWLMGSPEE
jgi:membrane-bound metal-dependent hydrolase YbcI (DUF457 family)